MSHIRPCSQARRCRGYAPVIRGVATSNAHVAVSQNGAVLYETNVAPGPFEINVAAAQPDRCR
ncbi:fimbria/pilus outer membrane usher protein [Burkholderia sola]|uniref:Fimbria/pilus outer membrane usher protein n=1 Tax=Burkholderia sola TaxID=2843302 RepID=A0ABV2CES9_9BURK